MQHPLPRVLQLIIFALLTVGTWSYVIVADSSQDTDNPLVSYSMVQRDTQSFKPIIHPWGRDTDHTPTSVCGLDQHFKPSSCTATLLDYHDHSDSTFNKAEFFIFDDKCNQVGYFNGARAKYAVPGGVSLKSALQEPLVVYINGSWIPSWSTNDYPRGSKFSYNEKQNWWVAVSHNITGYHGDLWKLRVIFDCTPPVGSGKGPVRV